LRFILDGQIGHSINKERLGVAKQSSHADAIQVVHGEGSSIINPRIMGWLWPAGALLRTTGRSQLKALTRSSQFSSRASNKRPLDCKFSSLSHSASRDHLSLSVPSSIPKSTCELNYPKINIDELGFPLSPDRQQGIDQRTYHRYPSKSRFDTVEREEAGEGDARLGRTMREACRKVFRIERDGMWERVIVVTAAIWTCSRSSQLDSSTRDGTEISKDRLME
jgi:hypothetical protein